MSTTFRRYAPDQSLLPPDVREWLPEGHLAHHVSDLVDGLDVTGSTARTRETAAATRRMEPRMIVKVLVYAYATGVFSDVALRVLRADDPFRAANVLRRRLLAR